MVSKKQLKMLLFVVWPAKSSNVYDKAYENPQNSSFLGG